MSVKQVRKQDATKDGRRWIFYTYVTDINGNKKKYCSKKFMTRKQAETAEREYIVAVDKKIINISDMTFQELYEEFVEYKSDKVKYSTMYDYRMYHNGFKKLWSMKIGDFTIEDYKKWRAIMSKKKLAIKTKNGYHKFLKTLLNYGTRWHDFNFTSIYNKMEKFTDPNGVKKEMEFYTYEEFQQFLSVISKLKDRCVYQTLYYCGLRCGELRGLTWTDLDLEEKTLTVNKNVTNNKGEKGHWVLTTPKTRTSYRTVPMPDVLVEDLKEWKKYNKEHVYGWNNKYFVFGTDVPLDQHKLRTDKNDYAKEAGEEIYRLIKNKYKSKSM